MAKKVRLQKIPLSDFETIMSRYATVPKLRFGEVQLIANQYDINRQMFELTFMNVVKRSAPEVYRYEAKHFITNPSIFMIGVGCEVGGVDKHIKPGVIKKIRISALCSTLAEFSLNRKWKYIEKNAKASSDEVVTQSLPMDDKDKLVALLTEENPFLLSLFERAMEDYPDFTLEMYAQVITIFEAHLYKAILSQVVIREDFYREDESAVDVTKTEEVKAE